MSFVCGIEPSMPRTKKYVGIVVAFPGPTAPIVYGVIREFACDELLVRGSD